MTIKDLNKQVIIDDNYDVCIVGSGVAGITLAISLAKKGIKVVVLEGGAFKFSNKSQDTYKGSTISEFFHPELHHYRFKQAGGSSSKWAGRSVELDPGDFKKTDEQGNRYWPIEYEDLIAY